MNSPEPPPERGAFWKSCGEHWSLQPELDGLYGGLPGVDAHFAAEKVQ
jgi:hypothetical protein